jgi:hypothetical protein
MSVFSFRRSLSVRLLLTTIASLGSFHGSQYTFAQPEPTPAKWLPKSTIAYLELSPAESFLDHPIRKQIRKSTTFRTIWSHPNLTQARVGLTAVEFALGEKIDSILKKVNHGGMHVAFDAETQGLVLLARTESEEWLEEYLQKLKDLARSDAKSKNQPNPIEEKSYRDIPGAKFQEAIVAPLGPWLMLTNKPDLAKATIDRYLDSSLDTLAANEAFQKHNHRMLKTNDAASPPADVNASQVIGRLFVDLETLRTAGVAKELLSPDRKDFGAELLLGGLLASLQKSMSASAEIAMTPSGFLLNAQLPIESESLQESHAFFVGPDHNGLAPRVVNVPGAVASVGAYRDISQLWLKAGDLFDQAVNDQLAQADSTLTTLFSGKDFAEDILGVIEPQLQLVVAKQTDRNSELVPSIRLPAFALVGQLKEASKMRRELKRTFQSLIGFLNIVGAMEGQPQLELMSDTKAEQGSEFYWAEYLLDADKEYDNGLPIQFNFQPCIAFSGDQVAVASTVEIAEQIFSPNSDKTESTLTKLDSANTTMVLDVTSIASLLFENRETLITNNILEKGYSRQQAEEEVDLLFVVLGMFKELRASLSFQGATELSLELDIQSEAKRDAK